MLSAAAAMRTDLVGGEAFRLRSVSGMGRGLTVAAVQYVSISSCVIIQFSMLACPVATTFE